MVSNMKQRERIDAVVLEVLKQCDVYADKCALIDDAKEISYAQLKEGILKGYNFFKQNGIGKGTHVVIKAQASVEYVVVLYALQLLEAITISLEQSMGAEAIVEVANRFDANYIVINDSSVLENVEFKGEMTVFSFDSVCDPSVEMAEVVIDPSTMCLADQLTEIMFTTGTTGSSKGVLLTYRNVASVVENHIYALNMNEDDIHMITTPINHGYAIRRLHSSLLVGATVVIQDGVRNIRGFFANIEKHKVKSISTVAAMMEFVLALSKGKLGEYDSALRFLELGTQASTESLKLKLMELLPTTDLYNVYGSSEAGIASYFCFNKNKEKLNSIGKVTCNSEILFVDDDGNEVVADSEENAHCMAWRGDIVMKGYYKEEQLTNETIRGDVVFTNDIGYIDADGDIFIIGRKGEVLNIGGHKISPTEVEDVAKGFGSVVDCALVAVDKKIGVNVLIPKLFVVVSKPAEFNVFELKEYMAARLENYKMPKEFEIIDKIPRTTIGKIQRRLLADK